MSDLGQPGGPVDPQQAAVRVGTAERDAAVAALNTHREAGRLTSQEYEERSVRAGQATTWGDLLALFADLPEPRPAPAPPGAAPSPGSGPWAGVPVPGPVTPPVPAPARPPGGILPEPWARTAMGAVPILAVILSVLTHSWLWFLAIPLCGVLFYGADRGTDRAQRRRQRDQRRGER